MSINLLEARSFDGVYNELNGGNDDYGNCYAYTVDENVAHGGCAAGDVVLMPFIRAGIQQT